MHFQDILPSLHQKGSLALYLNGESSNILKRNISKETLVQTYSLVYFFELIGNNNAIFSHKGEQIFAFGSV